MSLTPSEIAPTITPMATAVTKANMAIVLYWRLEERHRAFEDHAADLLHLCRAGIAAQYVPGQVDGVEHGG